MCRAKPLHYHVSLYDLQLGGSWGYKGTIKVDTKITRPTKEIVLNSKEIEVQNAEILAQDGPSSETLNQDRYFHDWPNY